MRSIFVLGKFYNSGSSLIDYKFFIFFLLWYKRYKLCMFYNVDVITIDRKLFDNDLLNLQSSN